MQILVKIFPVVLVILLLPFFAFAQNLNLDYPIIGGISLAEIQEMGMSGLIAWLYYLIVIFASLAAFGVLVWGGIEYITSAGNTEKMRKAGDKIVNAVIGLLLVLIAFLGIYTINPNLVLLIDPVTPPIGTGGVDDIAYPDWPDSPFPEDYFGADLTPPEFPDFTAPPDPGNGTEPENGNGPPPPPPPSGISVPCGWPVNTSIVNTRITSPYGWRTIWGSQSFHVGIDIAQMWPGDCINHNFPIYATADGVVTVAAHGSVASGYGYVIYINHGDGYYTRYAHLKTFLVSAGQSVSRGQTIAYMGGDKSLAGSGSTTGCHLHYEVRYPNPSHTDPYPFMQASC